MRDWTDPRAPNSAGALSPSFAKVGDVFAQNFAEDLELGAGFAVVRKGALVADIRAGHADRSGERPWTEDSLACIYSTGKAVLSLLVAIEASKGRLDYDAPVAEYWPAFAANGKAAVTLAEVLSHQAGLCGVPEDTAPQTWIDWDAICAVIAGMAPLWAPGTANGYHPQTVGFIVGEVLRRVTGKTVGALLADHRVASGVEIYCGAPPAAAARAVYMPKPPRAPDLGEINEFKRLAFLAPSSTPGKVARADWMAAEIPGSNMHADARSLARFMHGFLAEDGLVTDAAREAALKERIRGDDLVLPFHLSWSAGLMGNINGHFGPNENAFGHAGFGGSCVVVDPENGLAIAYVMSRMSPYLVGDPRAARLIGAVYKAL